MPKRKRTSTTYRRKKSYGKRRKISPKLRKAVKSIVKSNIETKEFVKEDMNFNINGDNIYSLNPLYNIGIGVTESERIGNKIRLQRIVLKGILSNGANAAVDRTQPGHIIVWFVRTNQNKIANTLITGNFTAINTGAAEVFFDNGVTAFAPPIMLKENRKRGVVVMKKKIFYFKPILNTTLAAGVTPAAAPTSQPFVMNINMKNVPFLFEENNSGFQTKYNYYFLVSGFMQNASAINSVYHNMRFEYRTYFKDG